MANVTGAEQQAQRPVSVEEAVAVGFDQRVLNGLGERLAIGEVARRLGIRVGKDMYEKMLSQEPAFFDPITGKFDPRT